MILSALFFVPCLLFLSLAFVSKSRSALGSSSQDPIRIEEGEIDWLGNNTGLIGLKGIIAPSSDRPFRAIMKAHDEWHIVENVYANIPFQVNDPVEIVGVNAFGRLLAQKMY